MMHKKLALLLTTFCVCPMHASLACNCVTPDSPSVTLQKSTAVFSGVVTNVSLDIPLVGSEKTVAFDVDRIWKGFDAATVVVTTSGGSASCGVGFKVGEKWLVYANGQEQFFTSGCSRTTPLRAASADLAVLGKGKVAPPKSATSGLWIAFVLLSGVVAAWTLMKWKK